MQNADLIIDNISELLTISGASKNPKIRGALDDLGIIKDGAVAISGGRIIFAGESDQLDSHAKIDRKTKIIDAKWNLVMPGFVDCHTHLIFAGSREREWLDKLGGIDYVALLKKGEGILSTVRSTRKATDEALASTAMNHLHGMLACGTTTIEAKSGYGLTLRDEIRILNILKALGRMQPIDIVSTFLGAHAIPPEFPDSLSYAKFVIQKMIPEIARLGLAEYCDVFCEKGAFSAKEAKIILEAGSAYGMKPRMHTDEFNDIGGTKVAKDVGAVSVDHLDSVSQQGLEDIKISGSMAVLLPGVPFFLGNDAYADAKRVVSYGVPIALATDFNPGTCFCYSIPFIMSLACIKMKLSPQQAINAVTINAAHAIGRAGSIGSIEAGKQADLILLGIEDYRQLPYNIAINPVTTVVKNGKIVLQQS